MRSWLTASVLLVGVSGCGVGPAPVRGPSLSQALTGASEAIELEPQSVRTELFREIARISLAQAGQPVSGSVLFPILHDGRATAGRGFDVRADLLLAPDAGQPLELALGTAGEAWPEDRRESLQGLSEREVAELVARTLLIHWGLQAGGPVEIERATGAPYAVAYVEGILRVNPAFLYMVAAPDSEL